MDYVSWFFSNGDTRTGAEQALIFGEGSARILVLAPLFDEASKLRCQIVATMRLLSARGIASVLPDLPGCNESLAPFDSQTLAGWRDAAAAAAAYFSATHILALRSGCWLAPPSLPGWLVAPPKPSQVLRGLVRARTIANREAGRHETIEGLLEMGRASGLELAGWQLGAELIAELERSRPAGGNRQREVRQEELGGPGLWLRAEPDFDPAQADALARLIQAEIAL